MTEKHQSICNAYMTYTDSPARTGLRAISLLRLVCASYRNA